MGKPFTPERLENIRRMRKARRLFKKQPLFAYATMLENYPNYTQHEFLDDLRLRKPRKKKKFKSPLLRYGRYYRMEEMKSKYMATGNIDFALQAQRLRRHLTKPYRVKVRIAHSTIEYGFSPLIQISDIELLVAKLAGCKDEKHADELVADFRKTAHIS